MVNHNLLTFFVREHFLQLCVHMVFLNLFFATGHFHPLWVCTLMLWISRTCFINDSIEFMS